jgi:hypothetical protein
MTADWPSVLVGCAAFVLFAAGFHWAGRAWYRRVGGSEGAAVGRWKVRWSLAVVAAVVLLFAAGVAMIGAVHQLGWLATSRESLQIETLKRYGLTSSADNLKYIALSTHSYHDTWGTFPPGGSFTPDGAMKHSWATYLLPCLNYASPINLTQPWNHPDNEKHFRSVLQPFINPDLPGAAFRDANGFGLNHYAANVRVLGANRTMTLSDMADGASTTLLIGEVNGAFQPWGYPFNWRDPAKGINRSPHGFGGPPTAGGASFMMADGSVRFVSEKVNEDVLKALSTPAGGDAVDDAVLRPVR